MTHTFKIHTSDARIKYTNISGWKLYLEGMPLDSIEDLVKLVKKCKFAFSGDVTIAYDGDIISFSQFLEFKIPIEKETRIHEFTTQFRFSTFKFLVSVIEQDIVESLFQASNMYKMEVIETLQLPTDFLTE